MKNILKVSAAGEDLISSIDDNSNRLFINDVEIDPEDWTGSGFYTDTIEGHAISIAKVASADGNIGIKKTSEYTYALYVHKKSLVIEGDISVENVNASGNVNGENITASGDVSADSITANQIDVNGDITASGKIKCKDLDADVFSTDVISDVLIMTSSNASITFARFTRVGRVCQLNFVAKRTTSAGAGGNFFSCNAGPVLARYLPPSDVIVETATFYSSSAVYAYLQNGTVLARNVSGSNVTISNGIRVHFTWIYEGDL